MGIRSELTGRHPNWSGGLVSGLLFAASTLRGVVEGEVAEDGARGLHGRHVHQPREGEPGGLAQELDLGVVLGRVVDVVEDSPAQVQERHLGRVLGLDEDQVQGAELAAGCVQDVGHDAVAVAGGGGVGICCPG